MDCKKATKYIPDLYSGNISPQVRKLVEQHLGQCDHCAQWARNWQELKAMGQEASVFPDAFDWSSFDQALDAEMRLHPITPGSTQPIQNLLRRIYGYLWTSPRRSLPRWGLAGAAALVLAIFLFPKEEPVSPIQYKLRLGEYLVSSQDSELVVYEDGEQDRVYYHEEINLVLPEGYDY